MTGLLSSEGGVRGIERHFSYFFLIILIFFFFFVACSRRNPALGILIGIESAPFMIPPSVQHQTDSMSIAS